MILLAALFDRSVHLAHVSLAEEILLIRRVKERGLKVTCEVAPHISSLEPGDDFQAQLRPERSSRDWQRQPMCRLCGITWT